MDTELKTPRFYMLGPLFAACATPIVYTYVSQFQIPRANWAAYSEDTEKSFVPVVEKSLADGTILSWSTFEQVVHTPDGYTHGTARRGRSTASPGS
jgi:hypothetical protein